jgi:sialate O-acetylesterase
MRKLLPAAAGALAALLFLSAGPARADVKPHALFTDGLVLQRGVNVPVWGTADPGEQVRVSIHTGNSGQGAGTAADKDGKWRVRLSKLPAGGPYRLTIEGKNKIELANVYVGDVWVCSGQSNMEWPLAASHNAQQAIAASKNPQIRLFTVPKRTSTARQHDLQGSWQECSPSTVGNFSAVAYFFGRDLQKSLQVPIGLIHTSWGGTVAEAWTSEKALAAVPELKYLAEAARREDEAVDQYLIALETYIREARRARKRGHDLPAAPPQAGRNPNAPSALHNGMIAPLLPYAIKGAIWYQGESNAGRAHEYRTLLPTLIKNWRNDWKQGDFPFLVVQLAPWMPIVNEPQESAWAELREAQLLTSLKVPGVGLAVITDVGDPVDIHPRKKETVGARLALAARALAHGEKIVYSGPVYDSKKIEGNKVLLRFKHVGGGLATDGGPLKGFTISGKDRKFHNATAEVKGDQVVVSSPDVAQPEEVRYGWANCPVCNFQNKEGLPASPFRTDDYPMITAPRKP